MVLTYITIIIFSIGVARKIIQWLTGESGKKRREKITLRQKLKILGWILKNIFIEFLTFKRIFQKDVKTWITAIVFHVSLILIFIGHLRLFGLLSILNSFLAGIPLEIISMILGLLFTFSLLGFILRRIFLKNIRFLSIWIDYVVLSILFIKAVLGTSLRIFSYFFEINRKIEITLIPSLITIHAESISNVDLLYLHIFFAELFIMFIPFSNLLHIILSPISFFLYYLKDPRFNWWKNE
ncbi:MAG: respiratory nitrate reductase subunit gamma [Saccharolobus sp.]|uniref:respiratory nitrate reductase subunit gamma n=1 Tax=Saccharolobus sp. TaxID=2100761 RepID=UPI00317988E0